MVMKTVAELHARWMHDDPEYRAVYKALADEFPETQERPAVYANLHKADQREETPE